MVAKFLWKFRLRKFISSQKMPEKQKHKRTVYSGRLEHICWNSFYPPRALMHYSGLEFNPEPRGQSRFQSASLPVQSCLHRSQNARGKLILETYLYLSYDKRLVFLLHLALFRLVGLSKRKIIEPSPTAFTGFPFALVFTCTFTECV